MDTYEKKYKAALERARQFSEKPYLEDSAGIVEYVFPELKESEEEESKKWILEYLYDGMRKSDEQFKGQFKAAIAWLEKQGDHKLYVNDNAKEMFIKALERVEEQNNKGYKLTDCDKNSWWEDFKNYTSCTIEQKSADKVEPKFKIGDWIVYEENTYQIHNIGLKQYYECLRIDGTVHTFDFEYIDSKSHIWTIEDAKDGDVLADRYGNIGIFEKTFGFDWHSYCYLGCNGDFMYDNIGGSHDSIDTYPATKEQRDKLERAMTNAGYRWNKEDLKLEKIEQGVSSVLSNSSNNGKNAWSEEDEEIVKLINFALLHLPSQREDTRLKCFNWLESLKDRVK